MSYPARHNRLWTPVDVGAHTGPDGRPQRWQTTSLGTTYIWSSTGWLVRVNGGDAWAAADLDEASDIIETIERAEP